MDDGRGGHRRDRDKKEKKDRKEDGDEDDRRERKEKKRDKDPDDEARRDKKDKKEGKDRDHRRDHSHEHSTDRDGHRSHHRKPSKGGDMKVDRGVSGKDSNEVSHPEVERPPSGAASNKPAAGKSGVESGAAKFREAGKAPKVSEMRKSMAAYFAPQKRADKVRYSLTGRQEVPECPSCKTAFKPGQGECAKCGEKRPVQWHCLDDLTDADTARIDAAFQRYDLDFSGYLDGKEIRMALRELGYDTPAEVAERWARVGGISGLNRDQFRILIASGKLGPKKFLDAGHGDNSVQHAEKRKQALLAHSSVRRVNLDKRRFALKQDLKGRPARSDAAPTGLVDMKLPPELGEGDDCWDDLAPRRRRELREAWTLWDKDRSGFLQAYELEGATRGLGFHFDQATLVAICANNGGGISKEQFFEFMSAQVHHRDQELGIVDALTGQDRDSVRFDPDEEDLAVADKLASSAKQKKELMKALLHFRQTSCTDKKFKWRSLVCTRHRDLAEYAVGVKLYFDLLVLLVLGFFFMGLVNSKFLTECSKGDSGGYVLSHIDNFMARLAKLTVGNLGKLSEDKKWEYCKSDNTAAFIFTVALLLYKVVLIPRSVSKIGGARIQDLALQVRDLPRDIGHFHYDYEDQLFDHFMAVVGQDDAMDGSDRAELPVKEVVLWRDYKGDVAGVLEQVDLLRQEREVDAELAIVALKAKSAGCEAYMQALADGQNARQLDEGGRRSTVRNSTRSETPDHRRNSKALDATGAVMGKYDGMSVKRLAHRLADRHLTLMAKRELIEERMLEIETARSAHADLKLHEREVCGAFVVFWSQRARDSVMRKYRWSGAWWGRMMQKQHLRFKPSPDGDNYSGSEDEDFAKNASHGEKLPTFPAYPIAVEPAQDPSLQLWENMDVPKKARRMMRCRMRCMNCCVLTVAVALGLATRASRVTYPFMLAPNAPVWVLSNITPPIGSSCWKLCEVAFYSDSGCLNRVEPVSWLSSNGQPWGLDLGLKYVHDGNGQAGSVCRGDWREESCRKPITPNTLQQKCLADGPCGTQNYSWQNTSALPVTQLYAQCAPEWFCGVLQHDRRCDPANAAYDPCKCIANYTAVNDSAFIFDCFVRGKLGDALKTVPTLAAYYTFDTIMAQKINEEVAHNDAKCYGAGGPSSACAVLSTDSVAGSSGQFTGEAWLTAQLAHVGNATENLSQTFEIWIQSDCKGCTAVSVWNGVLLVDGNGQMATRTSAGTVWAPGAGPNVADGNWHFVAHSLGLQFGERLLVDGELVANRSLADALAAGWSQKLANVSFGYSLGQDQWTDGWSPFSGGLDEAAAYPGEISEVKLRHHMNAGSWRGSGPTFYDRFLDHHCSDATAAGTVPACTTAAQALLVAPGCLQGDACACLDGLSSGAQDLLRCGTACNASTVGLKRTLLGLLVEQCAEDTFLTRTCQNDYDCLILHPPGAEDPKYRCNATTALCDLQVTKTGVAVTRVTLGARVCIARSFAMPALGRWQAQHLVAGFSQANGSSIGSLVMADGCNNVDFQLQNYSVIPNVTNLTLGLYPSPTDSNAVFNAAGYQSITFSLKEMRFPGANIIPDADSKNLLTIAARLQGLAGKYTDIAPNSTKAADLTNSLPYMKAVTPPLTSGAYAIVGVPIVSQTRQVVENCGASEYECSPGMCVACGGTSCLCDGIMDCPFGEDENVQDNVTLRNATPACYGMWTLRSTPSTDPCKGAEGLACNGTCVPTARFCDGVSDCPKGDDEEGCPGHAPDPYILPIDPNATASTAAANTVETDPPWVGAVFAARTQVQCVQVAQPATAPAPLIRLYACENSAVLHGVVPDPLRDPSAACLPTSTLWTEVSAHSKPPKSWGITEVDHTESSVLVPPLECSLGPHLTDDEVINYAAAVLAWQGNDDSSKVPQVVSCFCYQRLQIEPKVYMNLPAGDLRAKMCADAISMVKNNEAKIWARVATVTVLNIITKHVIGGWAHKLRMKDYTLKLTWHFWQLAVQLLIGTVLVPALLNWHLSIKQWHALVGNSVTVTMLIRVFWPHTLDLVIIPCRSCRRLQQRRHCVTQEQLCDVYTNPQFPLAEGYAEIACTACVALMLSPSIPFMNWLATMSLILRYIVDWVVFLRASARPPFYDEAAAQECVTFLLVAVVLRSLASAGTFADETIFPVPSKSGCSVADNDIAGLRAEAAQSLTANLWYAFRDKECNAPIWRLALLPLGTAGGALLLLPFLPGFQSWWRSVTLRDDGAMYDDLAEMRAEVGMISSYAPRMHPDYGSAYKLIDLTAAANDMNESSSSSEEEEEEESDEDEGKNGKADVKAMTIGKGDPDSKAKRRKKKDKKEKKDKHGSDEDGDGKKKHKKDKKDKSDKGEKKKNKKKGENWEFDDEDNEFFMDQQDKKRRKKEKKPKVAKDGITSALRGGRDRG